MVTVVGLTKVRYLAEKGTVQGVGDAYSLETLIDQLQPSLQRVVGIGLKSRHKIRQSEHMESTFWRPIAVAVFHVMGRVLRVEIAN